MLGSMLRGFRIQGDLEEPGWEQQTYAAYHGQDRGTQGAQGGQERGSQGSLGSPGPLGPPGSPCPGSGVVYGSVVAIGGARKIKEEPGGA